MSAWPTRPTPWGVAVELLQLAFAQARSVEPPGEGPQLLIGHDPTSRQQHDVAQELTPDGLGFVDTSLCFPVDARLLALRVFSAQSIVTHVVLSIWRQRPWRVRYRRKRMPLKTTSLVLVARSRPLAIYGGPGLVEMELRPEKLHAKRGDFLGWRFVDMRRSHPARRLCSVPIGRSGSTANTCIGDGRIGAWRAAFNYSHGGAGRVFRVVGDSIALSQRRLARTYSVQIRAASTDDEPIWRLPPINWTRGWGGAPFDAEPDLLPPSAWVQRFDNLSMSRVGVWSGGALGLPPWWWARARVPPQVSSPFSDIAVLMTGPLRTHRWVLHSIRDNVVRHLRADLFAYVAVRCNRAEDWAKTREEHMKLFAELGGARAVVLARDWKVEDIIQVFGASLAHLAHMDAYSRIAGQWRSPLRAETGASLFMYYEQSSVMRLLRAFERRSAWTYRWVIYTRSDLAWLAPHPPLGLFPSSPDNVWAPWGEDYGGVNDRHAIMKRSIADVYFGRWEALITGQALRYLENRQHWVRVVWYPPHVSQERFLWLHLLDRGIQIRRFAACAAVAACLPGPQCQKGWWRASHVERGESVSASEEFAPHADPRRSFKYFQEYRLALNAVQRLAANWRWRARNGHVEICGGGRCFPSEATLWDVSNTMLVWPPNHSSYLDIFT